MKALLILPLLLSSCVIANKDTVAALGGKGAYKGKEFGLIWDDEQSFQDGAIAVTAVAGAVISAGVTKGQQAVDKAANANSTQQAINANNNATAVELGAQKAGVETTKSTVLNPNVIPK